MDSLARQSTRVKYVGHLGHFSQFINDFLYVWELSQLVDFEEGDPLVFVDDNVARGPIK
jgi:hypothetical protein